MLLDVVISMHSVHGFDTPNGDIIDFTTDGCYKLEGDVACLIYSESDITGLQGTTTSIFAMTDKVVVDRDGAVTSRMIFQEGEKTSFLFQTPYGNTTMGIRTKSIRNSFTENGGTLEIEYIMDFDHAAASKNRFTIEVRHA